MIENPHPCCWAGITDEGSCTGVLETNLGPIEDPHDATARTVDGKEVPAKAGLRTCQVCSARHYFITADPGVFGVDGASLG